MISQMLLNKIISTKIARIQLFLNRGSCCVDTYLFAYYLHVFEETLMVTCSCAVLEAGRENMHANHWICQQGAYGKKLRQIILSIWLSLQAVYFALPGLSSDNHINIHINVLIDNTTAVNKIVKRFCFILFQLEHRNFKKKSNSLNCSWK